MCRYRTAAYSCQNSCDPGYYNNHFTKICTSCSSHTNNCKYCTFDSCTECNTSYYLFSADK